MKKDPSIQQKLKNILTQKTFDDLEPFKNAKSWKSLDGDDRNLLASLFIMLGENQLAYGDAKCSESFELATKAAPDNHDILYRAGNAYYQVGNNYQENGLYALEKAEKFFRQALKLKGDNFLALVSLGHVYNSLGHFKHEPDLFLEADTCFNLAEKLKEGQGKESISLLHWHAGMSCYFQAKYSGEALDYRKALDQFKEVKDEKVQNKVFWSTYGDALAEFASLTSQTDLFFQVIEFYRNAVRESLDYFEGWLNLACAFQRLLESYVLEEYYTQASECFKMASQIDEKSSLLWLKWAQLTASWGKHIQDPDILQESFEMFKKADEAEPKTPLILALWAEVLLLYGARLENVDALKEAKEKILTSLEISTDFMEGWYIYGCCLYELGRYFGQEEYYHQAIDKFQIGLSIKQNDPSCWNGLANTYYAIGDLREDVALLEKALQLFSQVLEFRGGPSLQLWNDWGMTLLKLAEITGEKSYIITAIEKFEQLIPPNPENWNLDEIELEWLYNYGCAFDFLGDHGDEVAPYEKSIYALQKVVELSPEFSHGRYNLALAYAHLGDLAKDVECFHKSIEQFQILLNLEPEDEQGWSEYGVTIIHLALLIHDPAKLEQSQKLLEIAESKLIQAVALGCSQALYHLACLHAIKGNINEAMHYLERCEAAGALPTLEQLIQDEWLEELGSTPEFRHFIQHIATKYPDKLK